MKMSYTWQEMLDDFRQLGGKAENIEQRSGPLGNGIFAIDPAQPISIEVPARLLIDDSKLILDGANLVVDPASGASAELCAFYSNYQKYFSWGNEGRSNVEAFETGLKTLPEPLLNRLHNLRLLNLTIRHKGPWDEVLRQRFLQSRRINYHNRKVVMPIIELINHSSKSSGYTIGKGISVKGLYSDEVTVNYQPLCDALRRFFAYGFASHELLAFSLPLSFELQQGLRLAFGNNLNSVVNEGRLILPKVVQRDGRRILSHLRIGSEGTPRIPRTLIRKALPDVPVAVVDEAIERVRSTNLAILCDLLELTEVYENQLVPTLRQTILCQLRALTHCYGVRTEGQTVL